MSVYIQLPVCDTSECLGPHQPSSYPPQRCLRRCSDRTGIGIDHFWTRQPQLPQQQRLRSFQWKRENYRGKKMIETF